jgi:hypothetical protein
VTARDRSTMAVLAVACAAAVAAACGGDSALCGNGEVDFGEQCDDGNHDDTDYCRACQVYLPPRTTVKWRFNAGVVDGFGQDACIDLGVTTVRVELEGAVSVTAEERCSVYQAVFDQLPPGPYLARVTPLDADGRSLIRDQPRPQISAATGDTEHTLHVPPEAWIGPYTGTFYFTVRWDGQDCDPAEVARQRIRLVVNGEVVTRQTGDGVRLDGTAPGPCVPPGRPQPQSALEVPFGRATIEIYGVSGRGDEPYIGTFDTFVGAGPSNPTFDFDVPSIYDAGPPDAMPPDATPPDAE